MFDKFLTAQLVIAGAPILWREIIGNLFGLASAFLGLKRKVWAWPVGIVGNILLFTVFVGGVFHTPGEHDLWGQAGRQVFFLIVSVYGWWRWSRKSEEHEASDGGAIMPRWASARDRLLLLVSAVVLTALFTWVLGLLNSWNPLADAWILTGSILATYGMARGLGRVLADLDPRRPRRGPPAAQGPPLPVGIRLHRLRRALCLGPDLVVAYQSALPRGGCGCRGPEPGRRGLTSGPRRRVSAAMDTPAAQSFDQLFALLAERATTRPAGSRTVVELDDGVHAIGKKIVEEAAEVWMAAEHESTDRAAQEISQLIYHVQVMMLALGLSLDDVYAHL